MYQTEFLLMRQALLAICLSTLSVMALGQNTINVVNIEQVNTDAANINLVNIAITERDKGNITESIRILSQGLENNPDNLRMKIELASSYYSNKNLPMAKQLVAEVLADNTLPQVVRSNADRFLRLIEEREFMGNKFTSKYKNTLSVFYGHDSNANIAPNDAILDIGRLPESSTEQSDDFYGALFDLSYAKPIAINSQNIRESLYSLSGLSLYSKDYNHVNESDMLVISGRTGLNYVSSGHWYTKGKISVTHIRLDETNLVNFYRLSGQWGYHFKSSRFSLSLASNHKDYQQPEDHGKQGYQFSQTIRYRIYIYDDIELMISANNSDTNLNKKSYSYHSNKTMLSLSAPLSNSIDLYLSSQYTKNKYRDLEKYYSSKREDTILKHRVQIEFNNFYGDFDAEFSYSLSDRQSNNDIHTYDRDVSMLSLKYNF